MLPYTLRNHAEAVRWCEFAIQVSHRAPIRRALMIACARAGDMARARAEIAVCSIASRRASSQACSAVKIRYSPAGRHGAPLGRPPPRGTFGVIDRHFRILKATSAVGRCCCKSRKLHRCYHRNGCISSTTFPAADQSVSSCPISLEIVASPSPVPENCRRSGRVRLACLGDSIGRVVGGHRFRR